MPAFNDLSNTATGLDAGFTFSGFDAQIDSAANALRDAAETVALQAPSYVAGSLAGAQLKWADGTDLDVKFASASAKSISVSAFELEAADGSWFNGIGKLVLKPLSGDANSVQIGKAALKSLSLGNDQVGQFFDGAIKADMSTGAFTGRLKSMTMTWDNDNPTTAATESLYVKIGGSLAASGSFNGGLTGLSGKVSGFEWGTMSTSANGTVTYQSEGAISGLKISAATLLSDLNTKGFDALMDGLYAGNDTIDGTGGADFIEASTGNDKLYGEGGNDHLDGGAGNDQLFGGAGDDTLIGGAGNDKIIDDAGNNTVTDTEGNANIVTGSGADTITTGAGNDKIMAGDGANTVSSGAGNDNIVTGGGADHINAGAGNDKIVAGAGADVINGGAGADKILGGAGADVFVFDNLAAGGKDQIGDFNAAEDILAFDTTIFKSLAGGITADNIAFGAAATDGDDYLIFNAKGGKLYYDADGNGGGAAIEIVGLKGNLTGFDAGNFADADMFA